MYSADDEEKQVKRVTIVRGSVVNVTDSSVTS